MFSMGWCMREPYCPLSSAVCNAIYTNPTLILFDLICMFAVPLLTFYIIFCLESLYLLLQ